MAAIFGIVTSVPGIDPDALIAPMQARLASRAPHGFTRWRGEACVLGHGALHVGPVPEVATQPLRLRGGRICIVDGFVANFDDVRRMLGVDAGVALDDAQLLALAIEHWGRGFTDHVQGEFALAVWDPQARQLELVCDQLGARSLCYVHTPGLFAFAPSSLALVNLPGVSARLNPLSIITLWYDDVAYRERGYTAFEGIAALAPGHRLAWRDGAQPDVRRYWRMQPREPLHLRDEREYVEAFREVFGGAVARAMRGSSGTALMLSGGIDSAAILAARRGFRADGAADDLLCVSAVLDPCVDDAGAQDENANILAMTASHPRKLQFKVPVTSEPGSLVTPADLAEAAWSWIHPMDISLLVPSLACCLARDNGCRLVLNGVDGDNVTSAGRFYMNELMRTGQVRHAWSESVQAARLNTYLQGNSPAMLFLRALLVTLEPAALRRLRRRRRTERTIRRIGAHPVMAPELARRVDLPARLRLATERRPDGDRQGQCDHLAYWLGFSMDGSHRIASRHGVEARHPWCDLQLVSFFQQLPLEFRARHGWTKWVVRQACEEALGGSVVWHSGKHHLGALLNRQALDEAAPYLRMLVREQRLRLKQYVREDVVADVVAQLGRGDSVARENCDTLLTIVSLAGWLRVVHESLDR